MNPVSAVSVFENHFMFHFTCQTFLDSELHSVSSPFYHKENEATPFNFNVSSFQNRIAPQLLQNFPIANLPPHPSDINIDFEYNTPMCTPCNTDSAMESFNMKFISKCYIHYSSIT